MVSEMKERDLKQFFQNEQEIPPLVEDKMQEAYQKIGGKNQNIVFITKKRKWKVAAAVACCLLATSVTVAAATGSFGGLRRLFKGSIKPIQQSSKEAETEQISNTFPGLSVNVEEISGTDSMVYMILDVKRTDGKLFQKETDYYFGDVEMVGENDRKLNSSYNGEANSNVDLGTILENDGTDTIKMALCYAYEYTEKEKVYTRRGDNCALSLSNLIYDEHVEMNGKIDLKLKLDYKETEIRECQPNQKIRFPKVGHSEKYILAGTLKSVTVTPYDLKYCREFDSLWDDGEIPSADAWDQVYLEMEDGTKYGNVMEEDCKTAFRSTSTDEDPLTYSQKVHFTFKKAVDVNKIKAVWFGKTKISLEK